MTIIAKTSVFAKGLPRGLAQNLGNVSDKTLLKKQQ